MTDILPFADGSTEKLRAGDTMFHAIRADHALTLYQTALRWGGEEGAHALYVMALATITGQSPEDAAPDAETVHEYFMPTVVGGWIVKGKHG